MYGLAKSTLENFRQQVCFSVVSVTSFVAALSVCDDLDFLVRTLTGRAACRLILCDGAFPLRQGAFLIRSKALCCDTCPIDGLGSGARITL